MRISDLTYIDTAGYSQGPALKIASLEQFIELLDLYEPRVVYRNVKGGQVMDFIFPHEGVLLTLRSNYFKDLVEFTKGKDAGFSDGKVYRIALEAGFVKFADYQEAEELGLATYKALDTYRMIESLMEGHKYNTHDKAHVHLLLKRMPAGSQKKDKDMWSTLRSEMKAFTSTKKIPQWYKIGLKDINAMVNFIKSNGKLVKIAAYDAKSKSFMKAAAGINRLIVIDGANVAWAGGSGRDGDKPYANNIILVTDALKKRGYKNIQIIVDAALYHRVADMDVYKKLKRRKYFHEAPAKRDADHFVINYAKDEDALIVTNDQFRDWCKDDPWLKENISNIRVTFMIVGGKVEFGSELP